MVLLEVERPLVWRCGVSAPAFTSQLSALELRPEWWLPRAGSGPGQVAEGLQVVSYGLLMPNQRARAGHRTTLGTHVAPFWDTMGLLFLEPMTLTNIVFSDCPGQGSIS